ncbi:tetratricopeptide repeat protein [bacterium]|nr:tetratricopeptide repeat protein [bacterium]MBU1917529.1 tetratricopeptide repeat protein [bacterium]
MKDIFQTIQEGKFFFKTRNYKQAEELLKKVVAQKKDYADVHNCLGIIAHEEGRYGEAIKCFKKALQTNPRYTEAMLNLSILYNDLGQYENAKKLVNKSRKDAQSKTAAMDPFMRSKLANAHADIADRYQGVGVYDEAIKEYQKALDLENYGDIRTKMAVCKREKGDLKGALEELKKSIKTNAKFADAYIQIGITYYAMGKKTEARRAWTSASKKFPSNKTIKMYLRFTQNTKKH